MRSPPTTWWSTPRPDAWAIDADGTLWLTQARPITTLYPLPDAAGRQGLRSYFCFSVAQGLYRPLTPMGLAAFRLLASSVAHTLGAAESVDRLAGQPVYAEAGQRMFLDMTGILRSRVGRVLMPRVLDLMETRSATLLRGLLDRPEFSVIHTSPRPVLLPEIIPGALAGLAMFGLAARLLRSHTQPGDLQVTLKGLPHNVTTAMDLQLWSLTQRVRADNAAAAALRDGAAGDLADRYAAGELPPVLQTGLADFLARYGHRAVAEIDVSLPRWSEDPTHILGVLANYLRLQNPTWHRMWCSSAAPARRSRWWSGSRRKPAGGEARWCGSRWSRRLAGQRHRDRPGDHR